MVAKTQISGLHYTIMGLWQSKGEDHRDCSLVLT